jgi:hypothetical protein
VGRNPFEKEFATQPCYPQVVDAKFGEVTVGGKTHSRDIYITVNGKVKKRKKSKAKENYGTSHVIGPEELKSVCRGGPEVLYIGAGHSGKVEINAQGQAFLAQRSIEYQALPTPDIVDAYNESAQRKAALIHVTC